MPEELAIAVVVLVVGIWLTVKILQGIGRLFEGIQRACSEAITQQGDSAVSRRRESCPNTFGLPYQTTWNELRNN